MNHNAPPLNHSVVRPLTLRLQEEVTYEQYDAERTRIAKNSLKRVDSVKKTNVLPTKPPNSRKSPLYGQCSLIKEMTPTKDHGSFLQIVIDCPPRKPQRRPSSDFASIPTLECGDFPDHQVGLVSYLSQSEAGCCAEESDSNTNVSSSSYDTSEGSISLRSDEDLPATRFVADFEKNSLESPSLVSHQLVDSISLDSVSSSFDLLPMRDKSLFGSLLDKVRGKKRQDLV